MENEEEEEEEGEEEEKEEEQTRKESRKNEAFRKGETGKIFSILTIPGSFKVETQADLHEPLLLSVFNFNP